MKKLTVILTSLLLLLCCIPCNIFAEGTYINIHDGDIIATSNNSDQTIRACILNDNDIRIVSFYQGDNTTNRTVYLVSRTAFGLQQLVTTSPCTISVNNSISHVYNNVTYYYLATELYYNNSSMTEVFEAPIGNASIYVPYPNRNNTTYIRNAIDYTFGSEAVDPDPPVEWGMLLDIGFSTSLATNGDRQVGYNIDYISWNNQIDSHGNAFIDTCKVEVNARAVFYWNTYYNGLFDQNPIDRVEGETSVLIDKPLATATMPRQKSWQAVANSLNISISDLSPHLQDNNWYQNGWIYEIRLIEETSGYVGPWQRLNTITSLPPNQTQNVYNSTTINQSVINAIEIVNNQNIQENTTNNETNYHTENWTINETVINSGNQPDYPEIPELINYEDDFGADLTNDLQDLDLDTPFTFLNGTGMQNALHWIRQVHLETIEQTELLTPLLVTMLVGLAVYLIGRRKG